MITFILYMSVCIVLDSLKSVSILVLMGSGIVYIQTVEMETLKKNQDETEKFNMENNDRMICFVT